MFADLRVPVERVIVEALTTDGTRHSLNVFRAPGQGLETIVESSETFFPAHEGTTFLLFARGAIMALSSALPLARERGEDEVPETCRAMRVHLRGGGTIEGELRYVPWEAGGRPLDQLNDASLSFALYTPEQVHHVVKAHVLFAEELTQR